VRKPRRFLLADALILTAATAVGTVGLRHIWDILWHPSFWKLDQGWTASATLLRLSTLAAVLLPMLAAWTVSVLVARLIPPRPSRRRIALQPGSAACGVAVLVLVIETVSQAASLLYYEASYGYVGATWRVFGFATWLRTRVLLTASYPVSIGVIAAWSVLLLSGRARPEPSWVDRTGRILGACWIAVAITLWLSQHFFPGMLPGEIFK
jgi:hypothetical protein